LSRRLDLLTGQAYRSAALALSVFHHISSHARLAAREKTLNFCGLFEIQQ
jgi:hypothetical protein